jgi:glutathione S-transferase
MRRLAQADQAVLFDHIEAMLSPYLCGDEITAADFYFYMMCRWDMDKDAMREGRPKLASFISRMRDHPSVTTVLNAQPRSAK